MTKNDILELAFYLAILLLCIKPLGLYIAFVYERKRTFMDRYLIPIENRLYHLCRIQSEQEMNWKEYAFAFLSFSLTSILVLYAMLRLQSFLPFNPQNFLNLSPDLALNTASSFVTNTNWQAYSAESSLSYSAQMLGLTVQNFLSPAVGLCILMAFIRGLHRQETDQLGNFWVDLIRGVLYLFIPLAVILSLLLVSQGVIQNFKPYQTVELLQKSQATEAKSATSPSLIPMGPAASQIAIKQLGTNGGGFFNANSAHPFENPSPVSNFLEMLAILLIPAALCYTFGIMVRDKKQGWTILVAMFLIFIPLMLCTVCAEKKINLDLFPKEVLSEKLDGNMEGKETRFGVLNSTLWAAATMATANGSTNASLDSFMPLGGLIPLWFIDLGESIFGGVGSGFYQMLLFIIVSVFVSGLMVGRTPEYLGKKIESYEMKMASFAIVIMPITVLICSSIALVTEAGLSSLGNPGSHGFTEILYAFSSMTNNNGSAFAGLNANTPFYNVLGTFAILIGRYWIAIPILAIAGSLAGKKRTPKSKGTLPTDTPLFILILVSVILIVGALTFFPAFSLGPLVEELTLRGINETNH